MQARFLLGPAGSGKTFRCLAEIRAALQQDPANPRPLILLAPKQATFQLERQLLAGPEIAGFTRLHILSFDRLAQFVLENLQVTPPKLLSGEGRVMVLRALLFWHANELQLFGRSARRPGLAQELSALLAELQQHQFGPAKLRALAGKKGLRPDLRDKLLDLALIAELYSGWLTKAGLQDADCLLDFVTGTLRTIPNAQRSKLRLAGLWLDGFAEMTPQELDLLAAVVPFCETATLAFCLDPNAPESSRVSLWSAIGKTFQQCQARLKNLPGCTIETGTLKRDRKKSRFAENPELAELEQFWPEPGRRDPGDAGVPISNISLTAAASPEAEAVLAAREILSFVREGRGARRFRDCAVLVRNLEEYHEPLARVLQRYEIPFFLDRRKSVAHHPLAELTRSALRTVVFADWKQEDWFAALKAGFCPLAEDKIDDLENLALAAGWRGKRWLEPLPDDYAETLRLKIIPPYEQLYIGLAQLNFKPDGPQLAGLIRNLWTHLEVESILETWSAADDEAAQIHLTVLAQMNLWLDNVALAFPDQPLPLSEWLPVLDAGLGNLTAGVIPPALDQVLVGAIDRARNPDLKFALILGVNESVFPAAPALPVILTESDRSELEKHGATLGPDIFDQISREQFLGYIACTRSSEKLALTYAHQNAAGNPLNPSPFITRLKKLFPGLEVGEFSGEPDWPAAVHAVELARPLVNRMDLGALLDLPPVRKVADALAALQEPDEAENLSPALAQKLYGPVLRSSVSRLEEFAACPFKFFVRSGLHANERKKFELDARERGNFQHDVLSRFQQELQEENKRWRDLTPAEARERIGRIAAAQIEQFRDGLLRESAETLFAARAMASALQDFVGVIVGWMHSQYEFDPVAAELAFGGEDSRAPAWEIDLGGGRKLALHGRIDRVDLWRQPDSDTALAVVTDYKSGNKKLDPVLVANGIQLQLLGYLAALRSWKELRPLLGGRYAGVDRIIPAGAFYVGLRGKFESGDTRDEVLDDTGAGKLAYRHTGRFDAHWLKKFDRRMEVIRGDQFNFRLTKSGELPARSAEALASDEFMALVDLMEMQLRRLGESIFSGAARVDPYRKGKEIPCTYCEYRAICRLDEWTHEFRDLREEDKGDAE